MYNQYTRRTPRGNARALVIWGLVAAGACLVEHLVLWPYQDRLTDFRRPIPYVLGVATVLGAFTGYCRARGCGDAARAAWGIAAAAGTATLAAYGIRARRASGGIEGEEAAVGRHHVYLAPGWRSRG